MRKDLAKLHEYAYDRLVSFYGRSNEEQDLAEGAFLSLIERYGPVVGSYPTWHPLVPQLDPRCPVRVPSEACGYKGLDHTVCFQRAFVSCPYHSAEPLLNSVSKLKEHQYGHVTAELLNEPLYNDRAIPVLVTCEWAHGLEDNGNVSKRDAVASMISTELEGAAMAQCSETWEDMRPYLLGQPHGACKSMFVSDDTSKEIRRMYKAMASSGIFGSGRVVFYD